MSTRKKTEQIISPSDSNEFKVKDAAAAELHAVDPVEIPRANNTPDDTPVASDVSLFDAAGSVNPSDASDNASIPTPDPQPEKRGRGRPAGSGKKKSTTKMSPDEVASVSVANAHMVVSALDLMRAAVSGGECAANPVMRDATVSAWAEYLETEGIKLPPWVQVTIMSIMYTAPAFATPKGKGVISGLWAKGKAAWISWRG
jgi:hypothetical protein